MITQYYPEMRGYRTVEEAFPKEFFRQNAGIAYSDDSISFLSEFSNAILKLPESRKHPALIAFSYWIRKSHLLKLKSRLSQNKSEIIVPRGVAFHITPSNVDIMFLYSWCLSLFAGNVNIVRISQEENELLSTIITILDENMDSARWNYVTNKNKLVSYPHDEKINRYLSKNSDLRIIWGGDQTVGMMKTLPAKPHTKDVCFTDKFSYCVINAEFFLNTTSAEIKKNIHGFYNDSYWFNQLACSSPQIVYFCGSEDKCEKASVLFWENLQNELVKQKYCNDISVTMDHLITMYDQAALCPQNNCMDARPAKPTVARIGISEITSKYRTCGGGFFLECFINELGDLMNVDSENDQTMTFYGFNREELSELIKQKSSFSACRIVPMGMALEFNEIWDGYNLLQEFGKFIYLQT